MDDLRDAFARTAPISPIPESSLAFVQNWLRKKPSSLEFDIDASLPPMSLSAEGQDRWQCLSALSAFSRSGIDPDGRWTTLRSWVGTVPLHALAEEDRYRMIAWVIRLLETSDEHAIAQLAAWLVREGVDDARQVMGWADWLDEIPGLLRVARVPLVADLTAAIRHEVNDHSGRRP